MTSWTAYLPFSPCEKTGEDMDPALALLVEKLLKGRAEEEKIKALALKHKKTSKC